MHKRTTISQTTTDNRRATSAATFMRALKWAAAAVALLAPLAAPAQLVTGLQGASGSAVGPGRSLYVTEGLIGRLSRIDPRTGAVTTVAEGLPGSVIGIGGAVDVAFIDGTAYVLVGMVGFPLGGAIDGIYRVDGPNSFTVVADIGAWSAVNPPATPFDLPSGVPYAMQPYRGGFLVTDGHHNRVLHVSLDGAIREFKTFDNIVPTGLDVQGYTVVMAQAGAVPHLPEDGKVVSFGPGPAPAVDVGAGAPLLVDVQFGRGRTLFALAQGTWDGQFPGSPALPNTGSLVRVNDDGSFTVVAAGLDRPTSMQIIGTTAYVVTLTGEVVVIEDIAGPPFGHR
jgi:hypothetical protein